MAELALGIIPLGITVASGLIKYLKSYSDRDDALARLVLQAEALQNTFRSLQTALGHAQLHPEAFESASEAYACLRGCQTTLKELEDLQQNIFPTTTSIDATISHASTKGKAKDGFKKLIYPLRKSQVEELQGALNNLLQPLSLTLQRLQLAVAFSTTKILNQQTVEIQKDAVVNSNISTTITELRQPISKIESSLPVIQRSVDAIAPRMDQIFQQQLQMQAQLKLFLDAAGGTRNQLHLGTNQSLPFNHREGQDNYLPAREATPKTSTLAMRADSVLICCCQPRRPRERKMFWLGPVDLIDEIVFDLCHEEYCDFYNPSAGYEKTRTIRFTGLASLLKRGIELSFNSRIGARGLSISPSLTYFPVVDTSAAAFSVMSLIYAASRFENLGEARCKILLRAAQRKLQELFCSGRASPNDVTHGNWTLLHDLCWTVARWSNTLQRANSPFVRLMCEGLLSFLVAAGTPVTVRDKQGALPLHLTIDETFVPASIYSQLDVENTESHPKLYLPRLFDSRALLDYYYYNQSIARIHYGPLSIAVIQNNLPEVERLISRYPDMLKELSFYGETPLHIAIYRLDILKVLAKKASPEVWMEYNRRLATVLNVTMRVSNEICGSGENRSASCCPCTEPLRIILAAGCPIIPRRDFRSGNLVDDSDRFSFSEASFHCKTLLAQELRSRRWQLGDLARNKLSITELRSFTSLETVPDVDAIEMDRLLRQKENLDLGPLSTFANEIPNQRLCPAVGYYSRSIFFELTSPKDADLFFESGFQMICADQDHDESLDRALFNTYPRRIRIISLDYAMWLIDHEAPLWKWSYRFTSPMPSIFVLADLLGMQDFKPHGQESTSDRAEACLSQSGLVDTCSCLCSPDGCTPFDSRMKWLAQPHQELEGLTLEDYATRFGSYVEIYGKGLKLSHHIIMVRQATFAALEMSHTCLDRPGRGHFRDLSLRMWVMDPVTELEPDEIEFETLNVDAEARNQLEDLVIMFQGFLLAGSQTNISSEGDSFDAELYNPNTCCIDTCYYQRAMEFWGHIWVNRMQVALDIVAKSFDNGFDALNDLVEVSTCEEAIQEVEDSLQGDEEAFNKLIQQIENI